MQLRPRGDTRRPSLRSSLALATATLLGGGSSASASAPVQTDASVLYYSEVDRVTALEISASASRELREDHRLTITFLFDALTGPSPNGATPSLEVQTFTTASGNGTYTIDPGQETLDPSFHDTRFAFTAGYEMPWGRFTDVNFGGRFSTEHDYFSASLNGGISRDLFARNTTLSLGLSYAADQWRPEGGIPTPLEEMADVGPNQPREGSSDSKGVLDAVFGVTQVLGRQTIGRVNYTLSSSNGYLTDPYKFVSVVFGPQATDPGEPLTQLFESRPDSRLRHSIYAQVKRFIHGSVVDASYRYHTDDWGVDSHTGELRFRQPVGGQYFVQPHVRYYRQKEADFFQRFVVEGQPVPTQASADPRLAAYEALTLGLKAGRVMPDGNELSVTLEWYRQFGMRGPPDAFGSLNGLPLWSEADAIMLRVGYGYDWTIR